MRTNLKNFPGELALLKFADTTIFQPRLRALLNDVFLCCLPACFNPPAGRIHYGDLLFRYPNGVPPHWLPDMFAVPLTFKAALLGHGSPREGISMATFPAVAACFSTLELLAGLWAGKIQEKGRVDKEAVYRYAKRFMGYNSKKMDLALRLYRHKIAHTSTPASYMLFPEKETSLFQAGRRMRFRPKRRFTWKITVGGQFNNLHIQRLRGKELLGLGTLPKDFPHYELIVDLGEFVSDIFGSVYGQTRSFRNDLVRNINAAYQKFDIAVGHLYRL